MLSKVMQSAVYAMASPVKCHYTLAGGSKQQGARSSQFDFRSIMELLTYKLSSWHRKSKGDLLHKKISGSTLLLNVFGERFFPLPNDYFNFLLTKTQCAGNNFNTQLSKMRRHCTKVG